MKTKIISDSIIEVDGQRYIKEDSHGWLDIPELNISVEIEVHDKNRSFNDLNLSSREDELLTHEEFLNILKECTKSWIRLSSDEINQMRDKCDMLSRLEERERLNAVMDYVHARLDGFNTELVKVA